MDSGSWVWWTGVASVAVAAGCGPKVGGDSGDTGAMSSTGEVTDSGVTASEGGDGTTLPMTGAVTSSADQNGESGPGAECDAFANEIVDNEPVSIEIRNTSRDGLLFSDPCFNRAYIQLVGDAGRWPSAFCALTCSEAFVEGCIDCGPCADVAYTLVPAGGTLTFDWTGALFDLTTAPRSCYSAQMCGDSCEVVRAPTGPVSIALEAITQSECVEADSDPDTNCDCELGPDGTCETYGTAFLEPTVLAASEWTPGTPGPIVIDIGGRP